MENEREGRTSVLVGREHRRVSSVETPQTVVCGSGTVHCDASSTMVVVVVHLVPGLKPRAYGMLWPLFER